MTITSLAPMAHRKSVMEIQYTITVEYENGEMGVISGKGDVQMHSTKYDVDSLSRPCRVVSATFCNDNGVTIWPVFWQT